MKKIISIFCIFMLFSCDHIIQEDIIIRVEEFKKGRYKVETTRYYFVTGSIYRVGDTLKIDKK